MTVRPTLQTISRVLQKGMERAIITEEDTAIIFYDLTHLKERVDYIKQVFPESTLHAIAVKANPLIRILDKFNEWNTGAEVASLPELFLAQKAGFEPSKIVFDSPAKTEKELKIALDMGVNINIDSCQEFDRIVALISRYPGSRNIGIRVNPQIGIGAIKLSSVAGEYSKFGIPVKEFRTKIISCYKRHKWLNSMHVHIGSQGCSVDMLVDGIKIVYDLAVEINRLSECQNQIKTFDIGGGFPVSYHFAAAPIDIREYVTRLLDKCPLLFNHSISLVTEFGRYLSANAGWIASRVEYIKETKEVKTAIIHVGADVLLRRCLRPDDWYHEISALDSSGCLKDSLGSSRYTIAGPLCFSGDMLAENVSMPEISANDFVIIHDTGAYALSMWSRYNSRQIPKVVGYYDEGDEFLLIKRREEVDDLLKFWI